MNPIDWIIEKIAQRKVEKIMGNLMEKLNGSKTYITGLFGMALLVVGHFWGPIHIGPVDIPVVDSKTMFEGLWTGAMALFLRHGISTSSTTPPAQ